MYRKRVVKMKSDKVKENLINNTNLLIQALEHYGFAHIKEFGEKEIRCGYNEDSNLHLL